MKYLQESRNFALVECSSYGNRPPSSALHKGGKRFCVCALAMRVELFFAAPHIICVFYDAHPRLFKSVRISKIPTRITHLFQPLFYIFHNRTQFHLTFILSRFLTRFFLCVCALVQPPRTCTSKPEFLVHDNNRRRRADNKITSSADIKKQ